MGLSHFVQNATALIYRFGATIRGRMLSVPRNIIYSVVSPLYMSSIQLRILFFFCWFQAAPQSHLLIMIWCPVIRHLRVACKSACLAVSL